MEAGEIVRDDLLRDMGARIPFGSYEPVHRLWN